MAFRWHEARTPWHWRSLLVGLACAAGFGTAAAPASPAPAQVLFPRSPASQIGYSCPSVLFLGLRGDHDPSPDNPPPGSPPGWPMPMDGSGMGADVAAFARTVEDWPGGLPSGLTFAEEGIPYNADYLSYNTGQHNGAAAGSQIDDFVFQLSQACPATYLVVAAQSTGAMVLHYAYQVPSLVNRIVVFGDPLHWPGAPIDGTCDTSDPSCHPNVYDNSGYGMATGKEPVNNFIEGFAGAVVAIPQSEQPNVPGQFPDDALDTAGNAQSWCLKNDGVCGSPNSDPLLHTFGPQSAHTSYRSTKSILDDAARPVVDDIASWWNAQNSKNGGPVWTPPPVPVSSPPSPPPPMDGLFLYNSSNGASYTELPDGSGGWNGIQGPGFSTGWQVYPGTYTWDSRGGLFVYNPGTGDNYTEFADNAGGWFGIKGPSMSPGWQVTTGNFTGDGRTDLFLYNPGNGNNWIEVPDGVGGWDGIKGPSMSPGWQVHTGDFNGDGRADLWLYNPGNGQNWVEFANGSGGWTGVQGPYFSPGWSVYTGDFNGDGRTDLFVYNPGNGQNWVELANGSGGWDGIKGPSMSPGWSVYPGIYS